MPKRSQKSKVSKRSQTKKKNARSRRSRMMAASGNINHSSQGRQVMASLNNSVNQSTNYLRTSSLGDAIVQVDGRETIQVFKSQSSYALSEIAITPANQLLFPRLAPLASTFQRYRFKSLRLRYMPACPATTTGSIGLAWQTDSNPSADTVPSSLAGFGDMASGVTGSVCYPVQSGITFDKEFPWYDVQSSSTDELATWAVALIASDGASNSGLTVGYVYLEYVIELKFPNISHPTAFEAETLTGQLSRGVIAYNSGTKAVEFWSCPGLYFNSSFSNCWTRGQFAVPGMQDTNLTLPLSYGEAPGDLSDDYNVYLPRDGHGWTFYWQLDYSHDLSPGAPVGPALTIFARDNSGTFTDVTSSFPMTAFLYWLFNNGTYYRAYLQVGLTVPTTAPKGPYRIKLSFTQPTDVAPYDTTKVTGQGISLDPLYALDSSYTSAQYRQCGLEDKKAISSPSEIEPDQKSDTEGAVYLNMAPRFRNMIQSPTLSRKGTRSISTGP